MPAIYQLINQLIRHPDPRYATLTISHKPEAEFFDIIGIKVFRVFLLASHSHLY